MDYSWKNILLIQKNIEIYIHESKMIAFLPYSCIPEYNKFEKCKNMFFVSHTSPFSNIK